MRSLTKQANLGYAKSHRNLTLFSYKYASVPVRWADAAAETSYSPRRLA
jgi:hypothetical protein